MKIAVLGYAGSGKTYLSDYLSQKKNIPVLHLDDIKWDKEWEPVDDAVVLPKVKGFMENDNWIIDGYYTYLMIDERLESADKIILLLLPRVTCFFRALKRTKIRRKDGYKNDMNWWFIKFILYGCRNKERKIFYNETVKKYPDKTIVLKTKRQVDNFVAKKEI
ncbi:MAG: DNA topology modulation protein FlaR [Acutalibacteraceae bacterium]|nr:DNA topology modulation protein FlaR [Acutalibacteraceae bacterium]